MNNKYQINKYLLCGMAGFLGSVILTIFHPKTIAQSNILPDNTLGAESSQVIQNYLGLPIEVITGGAVRGINQFHSFQEFNISTDRGAYFFIPDANIQNILARVTGNNHSEILGTLGTFGASQPNLYLMNSNGIIFGRNAELNLGGSFVATTANAIQFPGRAEFSTTSAVAPNNSLLSVNPTAFLFNQIANQGINSIENRGYLKVPENQSLILLGGNITPTPESTGKVLINGGIIEGGHIEIGGLNAPGIIGLNVDGNKLQLSFPDGVNRSDVFLKNQSNVFAYGSDDGSNITINSHNFNLDNFSDLVVLKFTDNQNTPKKLGNLNIKATGNVTFAQNSSVSNFSLGVGDSGNINIIGKSLNVHASTVATNAEQGNAGEINIRIDNTVALDGKRANGRSSSIGSTLLSPILLTTSNKIKSGDINIRSRNLILADNALIASSGVLSGDSGNIKLEVIDTINLQDSSRIFTSLFGTLGNAGNLLVTTNQLNLNNSDIISSTVGSGNSGNIDIVAKNINLNSSSLKASALSDIENTFDIGNAGNINIFTERITLTNGAEVSTSSNRLNAGQKIGRGGNINVTASDYIKIDATDILGQGIFNSVATGFFANTNSSSNAGDITLKTKNLFLINGGTIITSPWRNGLGNGGNISIDASESVELTSSNFLLSSIYTAAIATENPNPISNAGNLTINTKRLQLTGGIISSGTLGKGSAGNIFISSKDGVLIERGEITSFTKGQGNAGDISIISTDGSFFINNGGLVSITQAQGNGGNISIISNDTVVANNGIIDSSTFAQGNGGQISINSHSRVLIDKGSIGSITYAQGDAGNINIQTPTLIITNESFISTGTASPIENFPGGRGKGGNITFDTDYVLINKGGMISAGTQYFGDGGDIIINTRVLEAFSGGTISTNTLSSGRGGNITINAADNLTLSDITDNGDRTAITAFASSSGDAGTISLSTSNFNISNGAGVFTNSFQKGVAGNINITVRENFHIKNGFIRASAEQSNGGNIKINAGNISLRNDSKIRTDLSSGNSRGGNISLSADTIIALEDSDILAFASEGQGGNITFNTRAVFSDSLYNPKQIAADKNSLQSLINNGHSDINATGSIAGNIIGVPDISFIQNSLIQLQNNPIDTNALIANSCIARSPNKEGTFMITGTGGLPHRPGEVAGSSYPTGDVQSVTNSSAASVWKKGDRIVEPQGVYKLANGDLVMSRECS